MKRLAIIAAAALLVLVACGDDAGTTTPTTSATTSTTEAPGGGADVTVQGFTFIPEDLTVPLGTTVTWTNQDGFDHTTTADDGTWDGPLPGGGGTFEFTFDTAGTFSYFCDIHPSMTGTITVEG